MTDFEDRKAYAKGSLQDLDNADIIGLLTQWLGRGQGVRSRRLQRHDIVNCGRDGHPNARIVLLRSLEQTESGWAVAFYTNYQSVKGQELSAHPHAAATFFWSAIERQLRVRGPVTQMTPEDSDRYFASRPRESQIGAWASSQSRGSSGPQGLGSLMGGPEQRAFSKCTQTSTLGRLPATHSAG